MGGTPIMHMYQPIPREHLLPALQAIIKHMDTTLSPWRHSTHRRKNHLNQTERAIIETTRSILHAVSGGQPSKLLSSVLSESEQIGFAKIQPIYRSIGEFCSDASNHEHKAKAMQFIAPHISFDALEQNGFSPELPGVGGRSLYFCFVSSRPSIFD